jgi:hypothetical protein
LTDTSHTVNADWREADAVALEARAKGIDEWLDHTEDLVSMLRDDSKVIAELRSMAGSLKTRRDDFNAQAGELRTEMESEK